MPDKELANSVLLIEGVLDQLCSCGPDDPLVHHTPHDMDMPSVATLAEVVEMLRSVLFPGFFGPSELRSETMRFYTGSTLDRVMRLLSEQVKRGYCFQCVVERPPQQCMDCEARARRVTREFIGRLPAIRNLLATDAQAAFDGDPAATSPGETVYCYPSLLAMTHHRIAHELYKLGVPLIPRIISEMSHSKTGIDLHPGAQIGPKFFMDHGTGIVIGETTVIGTNVRLYQGVTLGAKSFPKDAQGNPIKGIARHPLVEDDVIIYAHATILGRITVGKGSVIGGNMWVTEEVPPGSRVFQ